MSKMSTRVINSEEMAALDLPSSLLQLYPLAAVASKNEALILAQHVVLMEIGFIPKEEKEALPKGYKGRHYSKIDYTHLNCKDSFVRVHFVPLGASVVVHGTVIGVRHETISLPLNGNDYICSSNGFEDPVKIYQNYHKISTFFKDNFAYKLLAELEDACGVERSFGLASIPAGIKASMENHPPAKEPVPGTSSGLSDQLGGPRIASEFIRIDGHDATSTFLKNMSSRLYNELVTKKPYTLLQIVFIAWCTGTETKQVLSMNMRKISDFLSEGGFQEYPENIKHILPFKSLWEYIEYDEFLHFLDKYAAERKLSKDKIVHGLITAGCTRFRK